MGWFGGGCGGFDGLRVGRGGALKYGRIDFKSRVLCWVLCIVLGSMRRIE